MNNDLKSIEIYPKIVVYKNMFKDVQKNYEILKKSFENSGKNFLGEWQTWSQFGQYIPELLSSYYRDQLISSVPLSEHKNSLDYDYLEKLNCNNKTSEDEKNFILEIFNGFNIATQDYANRYNISLDKEELARDENNNLIKLWRKMGPGIARYREDISSDRKADRHDLAMTYHTDYVREPIVSPGYKFAITALVYFNDDYESGEIDFAVGNDLYKYKPEAGDYLLFPSGHPEILNFNDSILLHAALLPNGPAKYISRMYWQKYDSGSKEWYEKEKEFGKDVWAEMQLEIMSKFRSDNPNKTKFLNKNRIQ